jgi:hypothetical protein
MAYVGCKLGSPSLVDLLRSTLKRLAQLEGLRPNDPALQEVKRSILRSIAELEIARSSTRRAA